MAKNKIFKNIIQGLKDTKHMVSLPKSQLQKKLLRQSGNEQDYELFDKKTGKDLGEEDNLTVYKNPQQKGQ